MRHPETSPRAAGTREEPRADTWENRSRQVLRLETLLLPGQFVGSAPLRLGTRQARMWFLLRFLSRDQTLTETNIIICLTGF